MKITKVEVQDYTEMAVRIVVERGEDAPLSIVAGRSELGSMTLRDGKLTRDRATVDPFVQAIVAEHSAEIVPDDLTIEYAPSLRVEDTPQPSPRR